MRRTKEEAMRTRASIMDSALDVFAEKSFANASVSEITARIGLSKGAFYWHFKNKQDILVKIIEERCVSDIEEMRRKHEESPESVGSMRSYFKESLERLKSESQWQKIHTLMIRRYEWPEEVRERVFQILQESTRREIKVLRDYIERQQRAGAIRKSLPAERAAMLFSMVFRGICIQQLSGVLPEDFAESLDILFDALGKEIAPEQKA